MENKIESGTTEIEEESEVICRSALAEHRKRIMMPGRARKAICAVVLEARGKL
jgi:hypothetical protein